MLGLSGQEDGKVNVPPDSTHLEIYNAHSTRLSGKIAIPGNVQSYNKMPTGKGM